SGVSIAQSPTTSGETFTVTLVDSAGVLSASAAGGTTVTPSNGGKTLTIVGPLSQVNTALGTLSDTDAAAGSDTIAISASDSNGGTASQQSIAVTVNWPPVIAAPATATVPQNLSTVINGVSLSETGNTAGETFTVTLSDANGNLAATGIGVAGSETTSLTLTGSLSQVNSDLATLTDTDAVTGSETITVTA